MSENYQKVTSRHHGSSIRVTMSQDGAILTTLSGDHPLANVVMTLDQTQEIMQFLQEGLKRSSSVAVCDICQRHVTELFNLIPGALGNRASIRVCASCYDVEADVEAHELNRG